MHALHLPLLCLLFFSRLPPRTPGRARRARPAPCCVASAAMLPQPPLPCPLRAPQMVTVMVYAGVYIFTLRHAFRDHAELPYVRYRLTNMYIRLMVGGRGVHGTQRRRWACLPTVARLQTSVAPVSPQLECRAATRPSPSSPCLRRSCCCK